MQWYRTILIELPSQGTHIYGACSNINSMYPRALFFSAVPWKGRVGRDWTIGQTRCAAARSCVGIHFPSHLRWLWNPTRWVNKKGDTILSKRCQEEKTTKTTDNTKTFSSYVCVHVISLVYPSPFPPSHPSFHVLRSPTCSRNAVSKPKRVAEENRSHLFVFDLLTL